MNKFLPPSKLGYAVDEPAKTVDNPGTGVLVLKLKQRAKVTTTR